MGKRFGVDFEKKTLFWTINGTYFAIVCIARRLMTPRKCGRIFRKIWIFGNIVVSCEKLLETSKTLFAYRRNSTLNQK